MGRNNPPRPRPATVPRICLRCDEPFESTGNRICLRCDKINAALPKRDREVCRTPRDDEAFE